MQTTPKGRGDARGLALETSCPVPALPVKCPLHLVNRKNSSVIIALKKSQRAAKTAKGSF